MKLYTEEQVKDIVKRAFWQDFYDDDTDESLMNELTPIELPSEEEIESLDWGSQIFPYHIEDFKAGAKWVINHIKQQENEKI